MKILVDGQTLSTEEVYRGIGVYFKNVLHAAVKQECLHEWYILVPAATAVECLDPWVQERLHVIEAKKAAPSGDYKGNAAFTSCISRVVEKYNIDCFWTPNPLMMNVLFPEKLPACAFFATVHDLIPLLFPPAEWAPHVQKEYKRRLGLLAEPAARLLCVSEATRSDVKEHIKKNENLFVTLEAADSRLFYQKREERDLKEDPYIVFTGGFDYRKNIGGAVDAFARCLEKYKNEVTEKLKLYIVCKVDALRKDEFMSLLEKKGIQDRVILTGYISNDELKRLYNRAAVFFFPSFYEGFGLPVLEAMLAGDYIVCADNSSLPEVCGGKAMLFDAHDTEKMADSLHAGLQKAIAEPVEEKWKRQEYALSFSWEKTAKQTVAAFTAKDMVMPAEKQRLAIITPWPQQRTGIANYIEKLLPSLAEYFSIDVFIDDVYDKGNPRNETAYATLYSISELPERHGAYAALLYQFGNNSKFHTATYEMFCRYPGIAEIHDFILAPFFYHSFMLGKKKNMYKEALTAGYGEAGLAYYEGLCSGSVPQDEKRYPMCHSIVNKTGKVIFHNFWSRTQFEEGQDKIFVVPHPCFALAPVEPARQQSLRESWREKMGLAEDEILIGCLGFVNFNKRPETLIAAAGSLLQAGKKVRVAFWGENNWNEMDSYAKRHGMEGKIFVSGYLSAEEYDAALAMTDIVVNLRYPSMGEASGTLCEAFQYGKPVIVSNVNQYKEFPDEICWKVNVNANETIVLTEMLSYLIGHPEVRMALGENARAYAREVLSPQKMARRYFEIITAAKQGEERRR